MKELGSVGATFRQCLALMVQLAQLGLVHCDFNEFNLLVRLCLCVLPVCAADNQARLLLVGKHLQVAWSCLCCIASVSNPA